MKGIWIASVCLLMVLPVLLIGNSSARLTIMADDVNLLDLRVKQLKQRITKAKERFDVLLDRTHDK